MVAPTLNTGLMAVPTSLTPVSTSTTLSLYGYYFNNTTDDPITVTVTNTAGVELLSAYPIPPHEPRSDGWGLKPEIGLKWSASAAGLNGQMWGYTSWPL